MKAIKMLIIIIFLYSTLIHAQAVKLMTQANLIPNVNAILDDFNSGNSLNKWLFSTGAGGSLSPLGTCSSVFTNISGTEGPYSLKLNYNVSLANSYSFYFSQMGGQSISSYNALMFRVKGSTGGELFKIQLKSSALNQSGLVILLFILMIFLMVVQLLVGKELLSH